MKKENTSIRLRHLMETRHIRQIDILNSCLPYCELFDVKMNKSDISQYVSGKVEPNQDKLYILGKALNVSEAWLMGYDVPMEKTPSNQKQAVSSLSQKEASLVTKYRAIDDDGKKVVDTIIDREYERATIPMLKAAHERTDVDATDEMKQHDYDIMNDDNF